MSKTSVYIVIISVLFTISCKVGKEVTAINYKNFNAPPNCIQIEPNLFCDRTEISNMSWLEYEFWVKSIYGIESKEYEQTKIDSASWYKEDTCFFFFQEYYLRHPAYRTYSLVGVSQNQAENYSKWRSDRVFEFILVKTGIIEYDSSQTVDTYFSIEKYFSGNYNNVSPNYSIPYPEFRLPSSHERELILKYSDSLIINGKPAKKPFDSYHPRYGTIISYTPRQSDTCSHWEPIAPNFYSSAKRSSEQIYNIRGNVSEWTSVKNISAGGSWKLNRDSILKNDLVSESQKTSCSIGFRNVCRWKYWTSK